MAKVEDFATLDTIFFDDRAVVMSEDHPPKVLTRMNSIIRGIDLSSKLMSPIITGLIVSFVSLKASAMAFAAWAIVTAWVEYWLFISVYNGVPAIGSSNERRILRATTKTVEATTHAPVSVSIVPGTEEPPQENRPRGRNGMFKIVDKVSKASFFEAWKIYVNQDVVLPGVSLALLYFTVLRFCFSFSSSGYLANDCCVLQMTYWIYCTTLTTALEH